MTKRRYAKPPAVPHMVRKPDPVPFARRSPSGEYEVMLDGLLLATGFDTFGEATAWIGENYHGPTGGSGVT